MQHRVTETHHATTLFAAWYSHFPWLIHRRGLSGRTKITPIKGFMGFFKALFTRYGLCWHAGSMWAQQNLAKNQTDTLKRKIWLYKQGTIAVWKYLSHNKDDVDKKQVRSAPQNSIWWLQKTHVNVIQSNELSNELFFLMPLPMLHHTKVQKGLFSLRKISPINPEWLILSRQSYLIHLLKFPVFCHIEIPSIWQKN